MVKVHFVVVHGSTKGYERFWNDLNNVLDRVCNGYRLRMIHLKRWVWGWGEGRYN